jgi:hypothetical protein
VRGRMWHESLTQSAPGGSIPPRQMLPPAGHLAIYQMDIGPPR